MALTYAEQQMARDFARYAETGDIGQIKDIMTTEYVILGIDLLRARISIKDKDGNTALILASKNGHTDIVKLLFQKGADLENQNKDGSTALMLASDNGHTEIVKILVEPHIWNGASLNVQDKNGNTALILASKNGHTDIVELLLEKGAPPGCPHLDMQQNKNGETALMLASDNGQTETVRLLVEKGANLDIKGKDGATALKTASKKGYTEIVRLLVEKGANLDIQNKYGNTALMLASNNGHTEIVKILVEKGASLDIQNEQGETALTLASYKGHAEIVKILVEKGASLDIQDELGVTALVKASFNGHTEIVKILVEKGANLDIQVDVGSTALIIASYKGYTEIVRLLLEKGANLDIQNKYGNTALMLASNNGHTEIVRFLVEKGANVNIQNSKGKTAIYYAKNDTIKEILRDSQLEKWKGFTKSDIEKFDIIFDEQALDYSVCPVCLRYISRAAGCLYMTHNCRSSGGHYHKKLYNKYKNDGGIICWCTCCSRICSGHRHYPLVTYREDKPKLLTGSGDPFEKDCRTTNGGGGLPEKLARFRRLREYALELQEDVDKKEKDKALDELIEEVWNAPLTRTKKVGKIAETKKWNISSDEFPKNVVTEANNTNAPNLTFHGKLPTEVEKGRNNVMFTENVPILRFHHKQKDGSEESHGIEKETLEGFVADKIKNFGDESYGFCFMYPACDSRLHPKELEGHVPKELYENYRKKFNKKFTGQQGGSEENVFHEATDAVCAIVKKHRGGSRKRRPTRRNRTRRL